MQNIFLRSAIMFFLSHVYDGSLTAHPSCTVTPWPRRTRPLCCTGLCQTCLTGRWVLGHRADLGITEGMQTRSVASSVEKIASVLEVQGGQRDPQNVRPHFSLAGCGCGCWEPLNHCIPEQKPGRRGGGGTARPRASMRGFWAGCYF